MARLSWFTEAMCFVLPPLLIFGIPMALGDSSQSPQAAAQALKRMFSSGISKPWLRWLACTVLWLAKALLSTIVAVVLRFQLLEAQVCVLCKTVSARAWTRAALVCHALSEVTDLSSDCACAQCSGTFSCWLAFWTLRASQLTCLNGRAQAFRPLRCTGR